MNLETRKRGVRMNKLITTLATFAVLSSTAAFAAKFEKITEMKSGAAQQLNRVVSRLPKTILGDAGYVAAYSFTRSDAEEDLNTVKQLNHAKAGLTSDDSGADELQNTSAEGLADHLLAASCYQAEDERKAACARSRADLTKALKFVKADKKLQIFGTNHADEDGSWQVLDVLDSAKKQVLFIKIGYVGT